MDVFRPAANGGAHGGRMMQLVVTPNGCASYVGHNNMYAYGSSSSRPCIEIAGPTCKDFNLKVWSGSRHWYNGGELKRRKRVAKYKLYSFEGKVKNSVRKSIRWFKSKCSSIVHGY